jgi:hypothetical protein
MASQTPGFLVLGALAASYGAVLAFGGGLNLLGGMLLVLALVSLARMAYPKPNPEGKPRTLQASHDASRRDPSWLKYRWQARSQQRRFVLGLGAAAAAGLLAAGGAIHYFLYPYADWLLPLIPCLFVLAWIGECWLGDRQVRVEMRNALNAMRRCRAEVGMVLLVTLAGLVLRAWIIVQYPFLHGMETDEVLTADAALDLAHSATPWQLYQISTGSVSLLQPIALSFRLFGPSILALRAPMVIWSTLLIPGFYLLARQFFSKPPVLCATVLLAFGFWPLLLGSFAFGWITGAAFTTLGLALLSRAMKRDAFAMSAVAGGCLALTLYTYAVGRYLPLTALIFLVPAAFSQTRPRRASLGLIGCFLAGFVLIGAAFVGSVSSNNALLTANLGDKTSDFQASFVHNPWLALGSLLGAIGQLLDTIFATPQTPSAYAVARVTSGGLLDPLTAALVLTGVLYCILRWRQKQSQVVLLPLVLASIIAATVRPGWLDTYRMAGIVPGLFLAAACALDLGLKVIIRGGNGTRVAVVGLWLIGGMGVGLNMQRVTAQLSDCTVMTGQYQLLSLEADEGALIATRVQQIGPRRTFFIVSSSYQSWLDAWLYKMPEPLEFDPTSGPAKDPSQWKILNGYDANWLGTGPGAARFWPPRPALGQRALTYIVPQTDTPALIPLLQRAYPRGKLAYWTNGVCPLFSVATFTLTAAQLSTTPEHLPPPVTTPVPGSS